VGEKTVNKKKVFDKEQRRQGTVSTEKLQNQKYHLIAE